MDIFFQKWRGGKGALPNKIADKMALERDNIDGGRTNMR